MTDFEFKLWAWALKRRIITGTSVYQAYSLYSDKERKFRTKEFISRVNGEKALRALDPTLKVRQMPYNCHWDFEYVSGGTLERAEQKNREFKSNEYKDFLLDYNKLDDLNINIINTFTDGIFFLWDMRKTPFDTRLITHKKYTAADNGEKITKEEAFLFPKDAIFTGNYERRN